MQNRQWILERRPIGDIRDGDLLFKTNPMPTPKKGEVVVKVEWLSQFPTHRIWMSDIDQYMPPVALGSPMRGVVSGRVITSESDLLQEGAYVMGIGSWSDYCCEPAGNFAPIPEFPGMSNKDIFGQLSIVGTTAYIGLLDIGSPKIGETLVVSGAAGAVGCLAGQLGKVMGCKVVGIAGGQDKCHWLTEDLGFDYAIDYKNADVDACLRELCPEGIDIFFDNVGGEILNTVLGQMNLFGRVVQCGLVSLYNNDCKGGGPSNYPRIMMKRLKIQGFIVLDHPVRFTEAIRALVTLHRQGRMKWRYHDVEGLENADHAARMLFSGKNTGKVMLKVANLD
jgi:NADPH-dependent curcumin reductase